jgi:hypothetical protein
MTEPVGGISPEQLKQLKALVDLLAPKGPDWIEAIKAIGEFIEHAGWPVVVLVAMLMFRRQLGSIASIEYNDFKLVLRQEFEGASEQAGVATAAERQAGPTAEDAARAKQVARVADRVDLHFIRSNALKLAADYERVRASMDSGAERTQRMEVVVAKMRTLGEAFVPLRSEFLIRSTPGKRLMVIASLQMAPDYEQLTWLVDRLPGKTETPFVGFHAALALVAAARSRRAAANSALLRAAAARLAGLEAQIEADADRTAALAEFKRLVAALPAR